MHPSQAIARQQMTVFDGISGYREGLTYSINSMVYLYRSGAQLQILCFVDGRWSHIVEGGYDYTSVMKTWGKLKQKLLTRDK